MNILSRYIQKQVNKGVKEKFENIAKKLPKKANTYHYIDPETLDRISANIGEWNDIVENAEDIDNPDREELIQGYKGFVDDYQVFSAMQARINKAISGSFAIMGKDGEIDEEETAKFLDPKGYPLPWFREFMTIVELAIFYGYEVIQLGDIIDNKFDWVEKIPEESLIPYYHAILKNYNYSFTEENFISIDDDLYKNWTIGVGSETDLGLLNKCAKYVIYKGVFGSWSEHADRFGMPLRRAKTNLADNERRQNLIDSFENQLGAHYIIGDYDDEIDLIEQKGGSDPHNIYGMLIDKCDAAISKIILSQTGTTDEKAHVGAANVHKDVMDGVIFSDKLTIAKIVNKELFPRMKKLGLISQGKDIYGQWDFSEQLTINDHVKNIESLSRSGFSVDTEEVNKKTGYKVDETIINVPENKIGSIMSEVSNMYKSKIDG